MEKMFDKVYTHGKKLSEMSNVMVSQEEEGLSIWRFTSKLFRFRFRFRGEDEAPRV